MRSCTTCRAKQDHQKRSIIELLTTPAKASLPITLPVQNWLSTPQHLDVAFELGEGVDDSTFLEGTSTFDVAGAETRNYYVKVLLL